MPRAYAPTTAKHCDDGNGHWTDYTRMARDKKPAYRVYLLGTINSKPPCTNRGVSHRNSSELIPVKYHYTDCVICGRLISPNDCGVCDDCHYDEIPF
jgi:hypothetical protein